MVSFVSYDGSWPCLCFGTLSLLIDGKLVKLEGCMHSGGYITFDEDYTEYTAIGPWEITLPESLEKYRKEIEEAVNSNVPWGCCGGCV